MYSAARLSLSRVIEAPPVYFVARQRRVDSQPWTGEKQWFAHRQRLGKHTPSGFDLLLHVRC